MAVIPLSLAAVYFYAMFLIDRMSMVIFLLFILLYSGLSLPLFRYMKRLGAASDDTSKYINSTFIESLNAVATIRSLGVTHVIGSRYSVGLTRYMHIHRNIEFLQALSRLLPGFLLLIIAIIALIIAPSAANDKSVLLLKWLALIFAALRIFPALGQIYSTLQTISSDFNSCGAVLAFIGHSEGFRNSLARLVNERASLTEDTEIYARKNYSLLMKDVSFAHADGTRKILDNITLNFTPDRLYGICGETGVGKSSVAFLLAGLLAPTKGSIRLSCSVDAEDSSLDLQGKVVMVSQAPFIISDSIRFNIEFGRKTTTEEFVRAVQQAHLQKVLEEKGGADYILQYQGSNLSGGQKQRISLARALLRSPAALILDETTAGLDAATKHEILRVLKSICQTTVVIMISHDHDVLRECETVYQLLDNGKITQRSIK
jgi:ABC-type bacteriocin/lantibiotic exporter with double-glycine peptidase domain